MKEQKDKLNTDPMKNFMIVEGMSVLHSIVPPLSESVAIARHKKRKPRRNQSSVIEQ